MKKLAFVALALVIALGAMGAGYASWSRSLSVANNVTTGTFNPQFNMAISDDDGTTGNLIDPSSAGSYSGSAWTVTRNSQGLDVGKTTALISTTTNANDTLTITLGDSDHPAYPGYWATVYCRVINNGNVPIKIVAASPAKSVLSGGGAVTDLGVSVSGVLTGTSSNISGGDSSTGYITIGIGNGNNGATTDPPVGGGSYSVTLTLTASQFNAP